MAQYYGVERSSSFIKHYGIKGMKWGVRKALKKHSEKKYLRQYRKAEKHLRRLEKRANNGAKYTRKAIAKGASTAASLGTVVLGITQPQILAYKAAMTGYNAYRAANAKNAKVKAQDFRYAMQKEFDPAHLIELQQPKRKRRRRRI